MSKPLDLRGAFKCQLLQILFVVLLIRQKFVMDQRAPDRGLNVINVEWLCDVIAGAGPQGRNRAFNIL